jgi:hypothetical protein
MEGFWCQNRSIICPEGVDLKPHLTRYWLTAEEDPDKDQKINAVCQLYEQAPALAERGERTLCTDDLREKVLAFIDYFNRMMAKPFKRTYQGKPLAA